MSDEAPAPAPVRDEVWEQAEAFREAAVLLLPTKKVDLDANPATNIGGLHEKLALVREMTNDVRDTVFQAMVLGSVLRRRAVEATIAYDAAMSGLVLSQTEDPKIKTLKTKEEREIYLQSLIPGLYNGKREADARAAEWEQFVKMANLVYYSLSHTRDDIATQVSLIKQQAFKGEIAMSPDLAKGGSIFDFLGEGARSLLAGTAPSTGDDFESH